MIEQILTEGSLELTGRLVAATNASFLGEVTLDGTSLPCIYKPVLGERPLWDFPDGTLAEREVATYLVAAATGWQPVPPTVLREGPMGEGMVQLWIAHDESFDIISAINSGQEPALQRMALLDAVVNNSDRKVSHLLPVIGSLEYEPELHIYGVDHGVSFHVENKLRTVLWGWAGEQLDDSDLTSLGALDWAFDDGATRDRLRALLDAPELARLRQRVQRLIRTRRFPQPPESWRSIPWPVF